MSKEELTSTISLTLHMNDTAKLLKFLKASTRPLYFPRVFISKNNISKLKHSMTDLCVKCMLSNI